MSSPSTHKRKRSKHNKTYLTSRPSKKKPQRNSKGTSEKSVWTRKTSEKAYKDAGLSIDKYAIKAPIRFQEWTDPEDPFTKI